MGGKDSRRRELHTRRFEEESPTLPGMQRAKWHIVWMDLGCQARTAALPITECFVWDCVRCQRRIRNIFKHRSGCGLNYIFKMIIQTAVPRRY